MELVNANNHLAVHLHQVLAEEKGNVFFSPFCISTSMAMLFYAAKEETEAEMKKALGYDCFHNGKAGIVSAFQQQLSELLGNTDFYTLSCANSVLIHKNFEVKEEYKLILSESFKALLLEADFQSDGSSAVKRVNDWVKEKTNKMIPQLVKSFSPNTVMVLLNAVYFKGSWLRKFDKKSTYKRKFYNGGKKEKAKSVRMMVIKETFKYVKNETFQAVVLPYEGENLAMLIMLPNDNDCLKTLDNELSSSFVHHLEEEMVKKEVKLNLPRFSLNYSKSLISCFQRLGIKKLFKEGAELGGANDSPNLLVSELMHSAVLEVNEEGSEAAAATMIVVTERCIKRVPEMIVDRPFLFAIYHMKSKMILFMGRVEEL